MLAFIKCLRFLPRARPGGAVAGAFLALLVLAGPSSAADPVDMRGTWACVATVGSARYPQTIRIKSENFTTGRISGTDVGGGMTFDVSGTVTGNRFAIVVSRSGYSSRSSGTVGGVLPHLSFSGSFRDSNGARGPFSCKMTKAVAKPKPSAAASSAPARTPIPPATLPVATVPAATLPAATLPASTPVTETPAATDVASLAPTAEPEASSGIAVLEPGASPDGGDAGPVAPSEATPSSDSNPLLLPLVLAALGLIGGLGAAAFGLIPGVPGIGGSSGAASGLAVTQAVDQTLQAAEAGAMLDLQTGVANDVASSLRIQQAVDHTLQAAEAGAMLDLQTDVASSFRIQQAVDQTLQAAEAGAIDPGFGGAPAP
ncbi:MAG TPA: hypothetical protein VES19_01430 [Candidatus Limnocylindrales bacterium]|nr:hypothetical protein [Candidatus Limnocylindrales bacterium]